MWRTALQQLWTHWKPSSKACRLKNCCRTDCSLTTGNASDTKLSDIIYKMPYDRRLFVFSTGNWSWRTLCPVRMCFTGELCVSSSKLKETMVMKCWSKCYRTLPPMQTTSTGERWNRFHCSACKVFLRYRILVVKGRTHSFLDAHMNTETGFSCFNHNVLLM